MKNIHVNDNLIDDKFINNELKINKEISPDEFKIFQEKQKRDNSGEKKEIKSDKIGADRPDKSI